MGSSMPAREKALSTSPGESTRSCRTPNAPETAAASSTSRRGRAADRRRRPEQVAEHLVVHVGAPGQADLAHLGGDQRAGRLGRDEQPEPGRVRGRGDPGELVGVDPDQLVEPDRRPGRRGVEQRVLAVAGRCGGDRRRVGRHRGAGQPGPGGRDGAWLAPAPGRAEQQRLGRARRRGSGRRARRRAAAPDRPRPSTPTRTGPPAAPPPPRRGRSRPTRERTGDPRHRAARAARPAVPWHRPRPARPPFNSGGTTTT